MIVGEFKDEELVHQMLVLRFRDEGLAFQDEPLAQDYRPEIFNGSELATTFQLRALLRVMTR